MSDGYAIQEAAGSISVTPGALAAIVRRSAESVEGVRVRRRRRAIDVRVAGGAAHVEVGLAATYGAVLPDVARAAQERVAGSLLRMCGLEVSAVDVTVEELVGA